MAEHLPCKHSKRHAVSNNFGTGTSAWLFADAPQGRYCVEHLLFPGNALLAATFQGIHRQRASLPEISFITVHFMIKKCGDCFATAAHHDWDYSIGPRNEISHPRCVSIHIQNSSDMISSISFRIATISRKLSGITISMCSFH